MRRARVTLPVKETDDGFTGDEGSFTICSFWLVSALAEIGEHTRARQLCEKLLGLASPLLLYAEEIDAHTGRHLGNFPQAFTHLALINAVMHIIRAEQKGAFSARNTVRPSPPALPSQRSLARVAGDPRGEDRGLRSASPAQSSRYRRG